MTPKRPMFPSPTHGMPLPDPVFGPRPPVHGGAALGDAGYVNCEMNWPKYALLLQSIELVLKACCLHRWATATKGLHNHDLKGWYDFVRTCGLPSIPERGGGTPLEILTPGAFGQQRALSDASADLRARRNLADETAHAIVEAVSPFIGRASIGR